MDLAAERRPAGGWESFLRPRAAAARAAAGELSAPGVSIVMAAYNADETLGRAVRSVLAQTVGCWELLILDDGSTDDTFAMAKAWAQRDPRIRAFTQANAGTSVTRNRALRLARHPWALILDADDWLAKDALESLLRAAAARPDAEIAVGRTVRADPGGGRVLYPLGDLSEPFALFAGECRIATNSAIFRREHALAMGGFDEGLWTNEDWDLWQRFARTGAAFAQTEAVIAFYRNRPGSLSKDFGRMALDALEVMRRGHSADPRVPAPFPAYAEGAPAGSLPGRQLYYLLWAAACDVGGGGAASWLGDLAPGGIDEDMEPESAGGLMAGGIAAVRASRPGGPYPDWKDTEARLRAAFEILLPGPERARMKALALAAVKARLNAGTPGDPDILDLARPGRLPAAAGASDFLALQLRSGAKTLDAVAVPALASISPRSVAEAVAAQVRTMPVAPPLRALRPWTSFAFWWAAGRAMAQLRDLGLSTERRRPTRLRSILRHRLRRALSLGLEAAVRARLAPALRRREPCAHAAAVADLRRQAEARWPAAARALELAAGLSRPTRAQSARAWDALYATPDPWNYGGSEYERVKYAETLELIGAAPCARALEIGCAEGRFTEQLADRVGSLLAVDISAMALSRAAERCARLGNVHFRQLDIMRRMPAGRFDLIVCSEVLYYAGNRLAGVARSLADALEPGGMLVTAHAKLTADEPDGTGFSWSERFGSKTIGAAFAAQPGLALAQELETPLYRVRVFRKGPPGPVRREMRPLRASLDPRVAQTVARGAPVHRGERTVTVPILMYHRVAHDGPPGLAAYRVAPQAFADQIGWLAQNGYWTVRPGELAEALKKGRPLSGRPVAVTFDDGYVDFETEAWPVLRDHGFAATVFVPAGKVGGCADWDASFGPPAPLMGWDALARLAAEGVAVESHGFGHRRLTRLPMAEVYREAFEARAAIAAQVGRAPIGFCYPYGAQDLAVERVIEDCGYEVAFGVGAGIATLASPRFRLPRLAVTDRDDVQSLARKLGAVPQRPDVS